MTTNHCRLTVIFSSTPNVIVTPQNVVDPGNTSSVAAPSIKDGKLRALALTSARRLAEFPDVPTMAEAGLPELVTGSMQGIVLPAQTPKPIIDRWYTDVAKIVALPEIRDRLIGFGLEPVANTPQEFEAWIKAEIDKWGRAMQTAKIDRI